jgi:glycosyltransferase involved in cell wall biosynthesis
MTQKFFGPIAYITGEYPRATDTFIQREVFALRGLGIQILTCSIRKTGAEHLVGDEQRTEAKSTFYVLQAAKSPLRLIACHLRALINTPRKYYNTLALALRTGSSGFKNHLYQLFYFAEAVILADHLQRNGVVHLHNHIAKASCSVAMLASNISGIPFSFTLHGPDIFFAPEHWRLDEKIKRAQFVACISHFCRNKAKEFSKPDCWGKLHIVHCGVEPARYADQVSADNDTPQLTFVGRLATVKGIPVLFDALTKVISECNITIIGDGPERAELETKAQALGLQDMVKFAGYKSQSEVAEALQKTDLFVLPSFAEGVPVVLMEAMAARVPVIATQIAGIPELVEHNVSGLLVPAGDADALANAISELIGDKKRRTEMGQAGHQKVIAEFNIEHESAWLARLFQAYCLNEPQPKIRPENTGGRDA